MNQNDIKKLINASDTTVAVDIKNYADCTNTLLKAQIIELVTTNPINALGKRCSTEQTTLVKLKILEKTFTLENKSEHEAPQFPCKVKLNDDMTYNFTIEKNQIILLKPAFIIRTWAEELTSRKQAKSAQAVLKKRQDAIAQKKKDFQHKIDQLFKDFKQATPQVNASEWNNKFSLHLDTCHLEHLLTVK